MIRASELLHRATDRLHEDLHALVTRRLPGEGFGDRRALVAQFVHSSRRALTQLLVLLEWLRARQGRAQGALEEGAALVRAEAEQLRLTLDRLFYAHRDMFRKRVASRPYDLPTAVDLLAEGSTAQRFPRELDLSLQSGAAAEGPSVEELNHAIHAALILREGVPPHFSHARVEHGVLRLEDWHQFALSLTLESAADPATAPWRLLDLQFLLPRLSVDKNAGEQQQQQLLYHALEPDARQRQRVFELLMGVLESDPAPLLSAYRVCRALCDGLRLEMLALQAKALLQGGGGGGGGDEQNGGSSGQPGLHVVHEAGQFFELHFWRGLPLLPAQPQPPSTAGDDGAMDEGGPAVASDDEEEEEEEEEGGRLCVLRVALEKDTAGRGAPSQQPRRLRASCRHRYGGQQQQRPGWWDTGGRALALAPGRISLPELMEQAYARLVPARLHWLQSRFLETDPALGPLLAEGGGLGLRPFPGGLGMELGIAGARVAVGVDRRTGHFVLSPVGAASSSAAAGGGGDALATLIAEWEAALRADPALEAARAKEAASRLLRDILRALLLQRVAAAGRARHDLPSDPRWRRLLAAGMGVGAAEAPPGAEEGEEDALKASRAAASSVYLTLAATATVPPLSSSSSPSSLSTAQLGSGAWQLLEVEIADLALAPQAFLITAGPPPPPPSWSSARAPAPALPTVRARRRLVPAAVTATAGEEGLAAWLAGVVEAAKAALPLAGVLDAVATALGLPSGPAHDVGAVLEAVRAGKAVELLRGNGGSKRGEERDQVMEALTVQWEPASGAWRWRARVPALRSLGSSGAVGSGERVLLGDGDRRVALAWGQGGEDGVVEVSFTGGGSGWHPLVQACRLRDTLAAVALLAKEAAGAAAMGPAHGFEVAKGQGQGPLPELRFRESSSGLLVALRHPALTTAPEGGGGGGGDRPLLLRLALLDPDDPSRGLLAGTRAWLAAEEEFGRTGDLPGLLGRIRLWLRPLLALGKAAGSARVDVLPWAPTTLAVSSPASAGERLLLVTVEEDGEAVRVTRHEQGDGEARSQRRWAVGEFTVAVAAGELAFVLEAVGSG